MNYRENLLIAAKNYCAATGKSLATVSTFVMNDGKFFDRIESGGGCTMDTYQKVMDWLETHTPIQSNGAETSCGK
ncbi:MAG: hypothetical protein SFX19_10040 [Alphaproteobacteria bacterium]|nr:hypothetical protein [Alphaproteobacteria bacterium]